MSVKRVLHLVVFSAFFGVLYTACSNDQAPIQPIAGDITFPEAPPEMVKHATWTIGPIEGLTTTWHPAPARTAIPLGTTVTFRCDVPVGAKVMWSGANEVSRTSASSTAECPVTSPHRQTVRVEVTHSGAIETQTCILQGIDVAVANIKMSPIAVTESDRMTIDDGASNEETMRYYFGGSIASLRQVGETHFYTSVDRALRFEVAVDPPIFAPLIEWRFAGKGALLGANVSHEFSGVGTRIISAGPTAVAEEIRLDTYRVRLVGDESRRDVINEGDQITLEAITEPRGFENEITWLSSTKFGTAKPVVGEGQTFSVVFDETWGPHPEDDSRFQWLGVRADNAVLTQDANCPNCVVFMADGGSWAGTSIAMGFEIHNNATTEKQFSWTATATGGLLPMPNAGTVTLGPSPDAAAIDIDVEIPVGTPKGNKDVTVTVTGPGGSNCSVGAVAAVLSDCTTTLGNGSVFPDNPVLLDCLVTNASPIPKVFTMNLIVPPPLIAPADVTVPLAAGGSYNTPWVVQAPPGTPPGMYTCSLLVSVAGTFCETGVGTVTVLATP